MNICWALHVGSCDSCAWDTDNRHQFTHEKRTKITCMNRQAVHNFHVRNIDIFIAKLKSLAKSSGLYICPPTCLVLWLISNCNPIVTDERLFTGYIALTKHNNRLSLKGKKVFPQIFSQQLLQQHFLRTIAIFSSIKCQESQRLTGWKHYHFTLISKR